MIHSAFAQRMLSNFRSARLDWLISPRGIDMRDLAAKMIRERDGDGAAAQFVNTVSAIIAERQAEESHGSLANEAARIG